MICDSDCHRLVREARLGSVVASVDYESELPLCLVIQRPVDEYPVVYIVVGGQSECM